MPSRFGAVNPATGLVDYHWNSDQVTAYPGPTYTYDPAWVNPASWPVNVDACPTQSEEDAGKGNTTNEYAWSVASMTLPSGKAFDGLMIPSAHTCSLSGIPLPEQATYSVSLTVTPHDGVTPGGDYQQAVRIKDFLVVSLGDSYGSGEGNPDIPVQYDSWGFIKSGAVWEDRRCHRSAAAAPAQAAMRLENADPHTSVTFLSFACSGASVNTDFYDSADPLAPYNLQIGNPRFTGSGMLGVYRGTEPPDPNCDYGPAPSMTSYGRPQLTNLCTYLDPQVQQLALALQRSGRSHIDALLVSGGGNDVGFGFIAELCVLYADCPNHPVLDATDAGPVPLSTRVQQDAQAMTSKYGALKASLTQFDIAKTYITEYPDPSRDENGSYCGQMLSDVVPLWMQAPLLAAAGIGGDSVPLIPYRIDQGGSWPDHGEVGWAGGTVGSLLNTAVAGAAAANGWSLVTGINDSTGNLFGTHGYCSSDSWIRNATDASYLEGPRDDPVLCSPISLITLAGEVACAKVSGPSTTRTKGTLHPTAAGHLAVADRITASLLPDLLPAPPTPPRFSASNSSGTTAALPGSNGWLIGATTCAGGGSCQSTTTETVAEVQASVDNPSDPNNNSPFNGIAGAAVKINGRAGCRVPVPGVMCSSSLSADGHAYTWEFAFTADGIYDLSFTSKAINGQTATFSKEVKVDLHDPTIATATVVSSANPPVAGWYSTPVNVALTGEDAPGGSGLQGVNYQVDGGPTQLAGVGEPIQLGLASDGVHALDGTHTVAYWAVDMAGRQEATHQTLTVAIDASSPTVQCHPDSLWHPTDVTVSCTAVDTGSGLANAADSSFGLATSVPSGVETADAPTATRTVCDVAQNCTTAGPLGGIMIDKKPPVITLTMPTATAAYVLNQAVTATYGCTDGGSGIATCSGPLPNGGKIDTTSLGQRYFTVTAADRVGNSSSVSATYAVTYRICPLYDPTRSVSGRGAFPVRLEICDVAGGDLSSSGVTLTATQVVNAVSGASMPLASAGGANPGNRFRFDSSSGTNGGYIFNLNTTGYPSGTYNLRFTIAGDPLPHIAMLKLA